MLDRRESVLCFSAIPSDVSDAVSWLSFSKFFRLRRSLDGGNSARDGEPVRRRLSGFSSLDSRFRFPRVGCEGSIRLPVAVEAGWTDLGGRDLTAGVMNQGICWAGTLLVEDRVVLLDRVGFRVGPLSKRAVRIRVVLLEAATLLLFLTPTESVNYQPWRLREEVRRDRDTYVLQIFACLQECPPEAC